MAKVTFIDPIASYKGAIDNVRDGRHNRRRLVVRTRDYGEQRNYDREGRKWHELYYYHFHEGPWSDGATRNREIIKAAQRAAHDVERDPEMRRVWETAHEEHMAKPDNGDKKYTRFYTFVFVTILRDMYERAKEA